MKNLFLSLFVVVQLLVGVAQASAPILLGAEPNQAWISNHGFFLFGSTTHQCAEASVEVIRTENEVELKCNFRKCQELVVTGGANISQIGCPANTKFKVDGASLVSEDGLKVGEVSERAISVTPQFGQAGSNFQLVLTANGQLMFDYEMYFKMNNQVVPIKLMSTLSLAK